MSGCEHYQELISCLLDGELNEEESAALAEHLSHCPECEAMFEAFSGLSAEIPEAMEEVPQELHENIMASVRREEIKKNNSRKKQSKSLKILLTTAACAALIVGIGAVTVPKFFRAGSAAPEAVMYSNESMAADKSVPAEAAAPMEEIPQNSTREVQPDTPRLFSLQPPAEEPALGSAPEGEIEDRGLNVIELSCENWALMEAFLRERESEAPAELPPAPDYIITLNENDESHSMNVYFSDTEIYCQTDGGEPFCALCNGAEFVNFLSSLQ